MDPILWIARTAWAEVEVSGHRAEGLKSRRCVFGVQMNLEESACIRGVDLLQRVFYLTFGTRLVVNHGGIGDEYLGQLCVLPVRDIVVLFIDAQDVALDGVALVVD